MESFEERQVRAIGGAVCSMFWAFRLLNPNLSEIERNHALLATEITGGVAQCAWPGKRPVCTFCGVPWHPASGVLVGHPVAAHACWGCGLKTLRLAQSLTCKKPRKGEPDFYAHNM